MTFKAIFGKKSTALIVLMSIFVLLSFGPTITRTFAQAPSSTTTTTTTAAGLSSDNAIGLLAAALAIAGSCLAAGYAVGKAASSAAAAIVEKPSVFGPLLILAGLGEGIAIYGLLVAFEILSKIP